MKYILVDLWDRNVTKSNNDALAKACSDSVNYLVINTETYQVHNDGKVLNLPEEKEEGVVLTQP